MPARVVDRLRDRDWAPAHAWFTQGEREWLASIPDGLPYTTDAGGVSYPGYGYHYQKDLVYDTRFFSSSEDNYKW